MASRIEMLNTIFHANTAQVAVNERRNIKLFIHSLLFHLTLKHDDSMQTLYDIKAYH